MRTQNLWDAVLRGNLVVIQPYLMEQEKHQIDNLALYVKQLEKEEEQQNKTKLVEGKKS